MNIVELTKQARENFKNKPLGYETKPELEIYTDGYIDGATKETELLSKHILELQKTNGALTDRVNELEKENESLESIKNFQIGDLLKAKEIIREYSNLKNFPCASGNSINMFMYENINKKAEAFLKE